MRQQLKRLENCAQRDDGRLTVKPQLIAIVAAVLVVGCGESQQSVPAPESKPVEPVAEVSAQPSSPQVEAELTEPVAEAAKPEQPTAKAPNISIHQAVFDGNIGAVKQHLDAGTDVNAKSAGGKLTPLHLAARSGQKEIAQLLIAKGADVNAKTKRGDTPLDQAIQLNRTEIVDLLREHGGKAKAPDIDIHTAAFDRDIEAVKQHLAAGTDVNAKGRNGSTPLHSAASGGHGGIVELLIAKGADVNANSNYKTPLYPYGKTPLDWANRLSRITAADLLRKHGGKTAEELEAEGK